MLPPYAKPHLTFADQIALLASRGMTITDPWNAEKHLARIGYYRLKDYWHPMRQSRPAVRADGSRYTEILEEFRTGTTFEQAVELYVFDKRLRLLMSDAIERIEVALRVDVAHTLGKRDQYAHRGTLHLDPKRSRSPRGHTTRHHQWLDRADVAENRSRSDWVKTFRTKYAPPLPIWMAVETWEFGSLSHLLQIAHPSDRVQISRRYGLADPELLISWLRMLSYVRNVCAHHARLWNHPLVDQPRMPKANDVPLLQHLRNYKHTQSRIYGAAAIAQYFLRIINPNSGWKGRLRTLWTDFPSIPAVSATQAGFMPTWDVQQLWQ